jgi:cytochrome c oxidase subunit I+III
MAIGVTTPEARRRIGRLERIWEEPSGLVGWLTTTDHKRIGLLYFFTTLMFFGAGGVEALLLRTQLIGPDQGLLSPEAYNQLFTMHGVTMVFLVVVPMSTGAFGNYLLPLMIGARDMAFPRMNALSYWIFLASGLFIYTGLFLGTAPDAGWFDYVPLAETQFTPSVGIDFYALGLIFIGVSTSLAAINFIVTIFKLRAPGMSLNRMPLFCYAFLAVSFALVFALPPLNTALVFLELDRLLGFHFYDVALGGSALLWQHLFWIFGHPEVYIIILPAFGIATSIIPAFASRRMIAYPFVAIAEVLVAFIGFGVWAHHMFAVGLATVTAVYFAGASLIIVIPSAIQLFAWITTLVAGRPRFATPLLWIVGFIVFFIVGGLSGIMFAAIPFDQQVHDTYFVVAHFHFVIFGAAMFPLLGGIYYWFPKVTGRMYYERVGQASFWLSFLGATLTFFPMHIVGLLGMPRRVYTYEGGLGWSGYNLAETIGSYLLGLGLLLVLVNLVVSRFRGRPAGDDPFDGGTLEWATSSPPPEYNYAVIPTVTSAYPMWDRDDRLRDARRLSEGVMTLEDGHETPATTVLDSNLDEVLEMPSESWSPVLVAAALTGVFALVLTKHYVAAGVFLLLTFLALAAWHWHEPAARWTASRRAALPNGLWGIYLLIATEGALFGCLIATYFYLRFQAIAWPLGGIEPPGVLVPLVLAGVLAATSLPMVVASLAAQAGRARLAWTAIFAALIVQTGYFAYEMHSFASDLSSFRPDDNAYGSIYYTVLGADHAHVFVGLLLDVWLLARLLGGLTDYRVTGVRAVAWYWHFANVMTLLVVGTILSAAA